MPTYLVQVFRLVVVEANNIQEAEMLAVQKVLSEPPRFVAHADLSQEAEEAELDVVED